MLNSGAKRLKHNWILGTCDGDFNAKIDGIDNDHFSVRVFKVVKCTLHHTVLEYFSYVGSEF
jgi:hypothetical protein